MKANMFLIIAVFFLLITACKEGATGREHQEADTTSITDGFNARGLPSEGIHEDGVHTQDSIEENMEESFSPADLPSSVKNKMKSDNLYKNREISHARKFMREGKVYYELTFDQNAEDKIVVDEQGEVSPPPTKR
ncbi:hypothetical protein [Negadavirga shengliensis]|uniref:Lipoprotein n=1 Tax=Negadavirga shengliensis TaxID=1389218 RepID=A0ABV9SVX4_9BACT